MKAPHPHLEAASTAVPAPVSPDGTTSVFRHAECRPALLYSRSIVSTARPQSWATWSRRGAAIGSFPRSMAFRLSELARLAKRIAASHPRGLPDHPCKSDLQAIIADMVSVERIDLDGYRMSASMASAQPLLHNLQNSRQIPAPGRTESEFLWASGGGNGTPVEPSPV